MVHADTVQFWNDLLSYAQQERRHKIDDRNARMDSLIASLETELAVWYREERPSHRLGVRLSNVPNDSSGVTAQRG
jgi:hypothetical protein